LEVILNVYLAYCDKDGAFLLGNILNPKDNEEIDTLYLGDSENDTLYYRPLLLLGTH
jgi:hypothetical protein